MRVAIDLDQTLFEFKSSIYKLAAKLEWHIPKPFNKSVFLDKKEFYSKVHRETRNLYGKIGDPKYYEEINGSVDMVNKLAEDGHQIVFLSSRPNMRAMNNVVLTWLENKSVNYDFLVVNCPNKAKFCQKYKVDVLVDDSLKNCTQVTKVGIPAVLLDTRGKYDFTKEKFVSNKKLKHAKNWRNAYSIVREIAQQKEKAGESGGELVPMP